MVLAAMLLKNGVISLMLTYFLVFILSPIVAGIERFAVMNDSFYKTFVKALHFSLPKVSETVVLINNVTTGAQFSLGAVWASLFTGILAVGLSLVLFKKTDF
jgi:hypothetical protein